MRPLERRGSEKSLTNPSGQFTPVNRLNAELFFFNFSGGLSNWLYHVKLSKVGNHQDEKYPREVLLRLYGLSHGECGFHHIITESVIFALLSERKLGPKLHGVFAGGRIEEYVPVSKNFFLISNF